MAAPADLAKGALRRLAQARLEPTPEHYARAYADEAAAAGVAMPLAAGAAAQAVAGAAWPPLIERLVRGLERASAQWTTARRKDSLQRVLAGSGGDPDRLLRRLQPLIAAWDGGASPADAEVTDTSPAVAAPTAPADAEPGARDDTPPAPAGQADAPDWPALAAPLLATLRDALPTDSASAAALADELATLADRLARDGPIAEVVRAIDDACGRARRLLGHRQDLLATVRGLCVSLGEGLVELAEDESWARGQCQMLQARLAEGINARSVGAASALLAETRERQRALRGERAAANEALKGLVRSLLEELAALGAQTERFEAKVDRHARAIERADSLQGLGGVVGELLQDTRTAQALVRRTRDRLAQDASRAGALEQRVRELESELRRLSDEVATDGLTQVANRRGLERAFDAEAARAAAAPAHAAALAVGLIDIDNFKRLNDTLGHQAGDEALKALAATVRDRLRQGDTVARFGGEEFVILLPATSAVQAQGLLTQLQRSLSASLFLHEGREVFVTFSAGVTAWRPGEPLDAALQRADEALYEAKRTGKNRTCLG